MISATASAPFAPAGIQRFGDNIGVLDHSLCVLLASRIAAGTAMGMGKDVFDLFHSRVNLHSKSLCSKGNADTKYRPKSCKEDKGPLDKGNDIDLLLSLNPAANTGVKRGDIRRAEARKRKKAKSRNSNLSFLQSPVRHRIYSSNMVY